MYHFVGTHPGKLDAKKRVSVPATFRNKLRQEAAQGTTLMLTKSPYEPCLDVRPLEEFDDLAKRLQRLDRLSERRGAAEVSLFSNSCEVEPDKEGRIVLPEDFASFAGLTDSVVFLGNGQSFQIWEPVAGRAFKERSVEITRVREAAGA